MKIVSETIENKWLFSVKLSATAGAAGSILPVSRE
jgi:hypothetical protein